MKKNGLLLSLLTALLLCGGLWAWLGGGAQRLLAPAPEVPVRFRAAGKQIELLGADGWEPFEVIGVNIGTGYPGLFPNESGIPEQVYDRWFQQIGEMNANTIRVYKLQSPAFYSALLRYNESHAQPLYLIQGGDFPEQMIYSQKNLLEPDTHRELFRDTRNLVDALHGALMRYDSGSDRLDLYTDDVSPYVLGYILGIEWDELFVEYNCRINEHIRGFDGSYFTCGPDANAFEVFLAMWGEDTMAYETAHYGTQPLMSFCNWPDTDPMINELENVRPGSWQRKIETPVDTDRIHPTDRVGSGIFASYNVYPYFPSFLQYGEYIQYRDESGIQNPYRGYLMDLTAHHSCPVVISEYGIPASRSQAYGEVWRNISHGGLTEREQGEAAVKMLTDIRSAGCAGSVVFIWQDEWYKTIWNESLLSDPDRRAYWNNAQAAEQFFGLLAFEPGEAGKTCYPDGDLSDWEGVEPVTQTGDTILRMQQDEKYLYFLVEGLDPRPGRRPVNIALDLTPKSGIAAVGPVELEREADFVLQMERMDRSELYVDQAYDVLGYSALGRYTDATYSNITGISSSAAGTETLMAENPSFKLVTRADGNIYCKLTATWLANPVGKLVSGNANPESRHYSSNADYCYTEDAVEIRIPWQLLNFRDPSRGVIIDDLSDNQNRIVDLQIDRLYAGVYFDDEKEPVSFGSYELPRWDQPVFHERLKESYYILKDAFEAVSSD